MAQLWLTPIVCRSPLILGGERIRCGPPDELASFRGMLDRVHPRFLLSFKARLLLSGQDELACGAGNGAFSLSAPGDIAFDGTTLALSDCGSALLSRLAEPQQTALWLDELEAGSEWALLPDVQRGWIGRMRRWTGLGWTTIIVREDA
ncbi:MAG: hypothetical protein K0Q94_1268 [Paenibacillus sp.]|nr:hypothetical protein [Paenibacillus sp.]